MFIKSVQTYYSQIPHIRTPTVAVFGPTMGVADIKQHGKTCVKKLL